MLTPAKIGKQNGDTRTRKPEPGYLSLSIILLAFNGLFDFLLFVPVA
jgi:hypothetical protein